LTQTAFFLLSAGKSKKVQLRSCTFLFTGGKKLRPDQNIYFVPHVPVALQAASVTAAAPSAILPSHFMCFPPVSLCRLLFPEPP
jgi:hypothetical protein